MRILLVLVTYITLSVLLTTVAGIAISRPVISSTWTNTSPSINGVYEVGEWSHPQITIVNPIEAYVYFMHDESKLYVLVDAVGDITDSQYDECLLVFNTTGGTLRTLEIVGLGGTVENGDFHAVIGFGGSPNNSTSHKIYEWAIPLSFINPLNSQAIDFCSPPWKGGIASMPYDPATQRDNVWPENLDPNNKSTWGILNFAKPVTVGGHVESIDNLSLVAPYLSAYVLVLAVAAIGVFLKRRSS